MNHFPESLARGARLLKTLRSLQPGEQLKLDDRVLMDCEVPAGPLDRQNKAFLIEWLRSRLPYPVTITELLAERATVWLSRRPKGIRVSDLRGPAGCL